MKDEMQDYLTSAFGVCTVQTALPARAPAAPPVGFIRPDENVPGRWVFINFHEARNLALPWEPIYRAS